MYDRDDKTFGRAIQISAFVYSLISNTNAPNTVILYTTVHDYHGAFVHLVVTQDPQKQKGKEKKEVLALVTRPCQNIKTNFSVPLLSPLRE